MNLELCPGNGGGGDTDILGHDREGLREQSLGQITSEVRHGWLRLEGVF